MSIVSRFMKSAASSSSADAPTTAKKLPKRAASLHTSATRAFANLIQLTSAPDDAVIQRLAERALSRHRSLDGCMLQVDSRHGVVRVAGTVHSELQKQVAAELLKNIDGVRSVQMEWSH